MAPQAFIWEHLSWCVSFWGFTEGKKVFKIGQIKTEACKNCNFKFLDTLLKLVSVDYYNQNCWGTPEAFISENFIMVNLIGTVVPKYWNDLDPIWPLFANRVPQCTVLFTLEGSDAVRWKLEWRVFFMHKIFVLGIQITFRFLLTRDTSRHLSSWSFSKMWCLHRMSWGSNS